MTALTKSCLLILALCVALGMVRLGVWQLDRAAQKQTIVDQNVAAAKNTPLNLNVTVGQTNLESLESTVLDLEKLRFRPVTLHGHYEPSISIYLDNQVLDSRVGYRVFTSFRLSNSDLSVLVDRGWLPVGQSRAKLPVFQTFLPTHTLAGRINLAPAKPPMLSGEHELANSLVWPYIPISVATQKLQRRLLPWVVELAPNFEGEIDRSFKRRWVKMDGKWVATHNGYAIQWFAMAFVFLVVCVVLALRSTRKKT